MGIFEAWDFSVFLRFHLHEKKMLEPGMARGIKLTYSKFNATTGFVRSLESQGNTGNWTPFLEKIQPLKWSGKHRELDYFDEKSGKI